MRTARLIVPLTVLALLAACSGDPEEAEPTAEPTQVEDVRAKETPEPGADEPADDAGADDDVDAPAGELAACILGEWSSDLAQVVAVGDAMMAEMGMPATTTATGETRTIVDATTVTTTYVDYVTEMTIDVEGQTIVSTTRMDGTMTQSYTLVGDILTSVAASDLSGITIESTVLVDGMELPGYSEAFQQGLSGASTAGQSGAQQVSCSGDTLTMRTVGLEAAIGIPDMTVTYQRR